MINQPKGWTAAKTKAAKKVTDVWESHFAERDVERAKEFVEIARITEAQDKHEAELLKLKNVVGVAVSLKMTKGKLTEEYSLTILVEEKLAKTKVSKKSLVPSELDGVPTDVIEVGKIEALTFNARVRPTLPGYSIGHNNITAGTFGCLVRDIRRCCSSLENDRGKIPTQKESYGDYLILSNNHVLADVNQGNAGDLILQPGPFDGGVYPSDGFATLERFEPIVLSPRLNFPPPGYPPGFNLVDAAVARPIYGRDVTASIIGLIMPQGIDQAASVGALVIKAGRTTQVTTGRVLATNATISPIGYGDAGVAAFRHQILTTAMSAGGDSGSLLMDINLNAVGLLFAGSPFVTIHNHIADVETALGVRPLTAPRSS